MEKIHPTKRMWRTLVRVTRLMNNTGRQGPGVWLIIPGWDVNLSVWCPHKAIPPLIFDSMEVGKRYHVRCNIGGKQAEDICFDGWEAE